MFSVFAKLFQRSAFAILFAIPLLCPAADTRSAKGGALTVRTNDGRKHFTVEAEAAWFLETKVRFDASALAFYQSKLITVNDQNGEFYELDLSATNRAQLKRLNLFPRATLSQVAPKRANRFDLEGIAIDPTGNIYVSEESQRLVFKWNAAAKKVEALTFDWSPVSKFFSGGSAQSGGPARTATVLP